MTTEQKILERITLLMRKAESTTPEEAEALMEHAERLMIRHGIDQARAAAAAAGRDVKPEEIVRRYMKFEGVYAAALAQIGIDITFAYGVTRPLIYRERSFARLTIVGFESDALAVESLVASLVIQARVALDAWWKRMHRTGEVDLLTSSERTKARRDYLIGFGGGAAGRLMEMRGRVVEEESAVAGTEVALLDRKAAVDASIGDRPKARGLRVGDHAADGWRDGRNANVGGRGVTAAGRPALPR